MGLRYPLPLSQPAGYPARCCIPPRRYPEWWALKHVGTGCISRGRLPLSRHCTQQWSLFQKTSGQQDFLCHARVHSHHTTTRNSKPTSSSCCSRVVASDRRGSTCCWLSLEAKQNKNTPIPQRKMRGGNYRRMVQYEQPLFCHFPRSSAVFLVLPV